MQVQRNLVGEHVEGTSDEPNCTVRMATAAAAVDLIQPATYVELAVGALRPQERLVTKFARLFGVKPSYAGLRRDPGTARSGKCAATCRPFSRPKGQTASLCGWMGRWASTSAWQRRKRLGHMAGAPGVAGV